MTAQSLRTLVISLLFFCSESFAGSSTFVMTGSHPDAASLIDAASKHEISFYSVLSDTDFAQRVLTVNPLPLMSFSGQAYVEVGDGFISTYINVGYGFNLFPQNYMLLNADQELYVTLFNACQQQHGIHTLPHYLNDLKVTFLEGENQDFFTKVDANVVCKSSCEDLKKTKQVAVLMLEKRLHDFNFIRKYVSMEKIRFLVTTIYGGALDFGISVKDYFFNLDLKNLKMSGVGEAQLISLLRNAAEYVRYLDAKSDIEQRLLKCSQSDPISPADR